MSGQASVWLGHAKSGGRLYLTKQDLDGGVCLLGQSSSELGTHIAYACDEAGLKTLVLDIDGFASQRISGHVAAYHPSHFLYDAMKIDGENPNFHAQLIASAYSTALDLSFEQEAVLGSVCQSLALEEGVASPLALAERLGGEDSSGNASKRLRGRLNSLVSLSVVGEAEVTSKILSESAVLDFRESMNLEVAELSVALVIAKLLALARREKPVSPDVVVLLHANRLFKGRPIFRQNLRLLSAFVAERVGKVLASDVRYGLDERFLDAASMKIFSSGVWNDPKNEQVLAPGMFALRDDARGQEVSFVPRAIEYKTGKVTKGAEPKSVVPDLTMDLLEAISTFGEGTRRSLVSYISAAWPAADVERELEQLINEGYAQVVSKNGSGSAHSVLRLTTKGIECLKGGTR
jgi:hypothetical protein